MTLITGFFEAYLDVVKERLPNNVRQFVQTQCRFLIFEDHVLGATLLVGRPWIIVLNGNILDRSSGDDILGIIAHEIAHAWLGHNGNRLGTREEESAAAQTAAAWGFTGIGATPPNEP